MAPTVGSVLLWGFTDYTCNIEENKLALQWSYRKCLKKAYVHEDDRVCQAWFHLKTWAVLKGLYQLSDNFFAEREDS